MAANSSSTVSKSSSGSSAGGKPSGPSAEQVVATFQRMRQEQRSMASKSADFEMDINEHSLVIETLKEEECWWRGQVKEVLPALESNKEQISKLIESINKQMQTKGRDLTEYRERYNIRLVGEGEAEAQGQSAASSSDNKDGGSKSGAGVLVS
ncbi:hypothetical protein KUCAC02_000294 [Chaenocephalus aceratus]|uniref:Uncharacterized protein n=1 Tax=Chaenocephalus aceratus TaxID=36190 RepID=A0ACB9W5Y9_CHAAC|nr:hypothetical protein KUCAC02_000294 [Chaenocephalus aceratus]